MKKLLILVFGFLVTGCCHSSGQQEPSVSCTTHDYSVKGNDTLRLEVESTDSTARFVALTDSLKPGQYFVVAFAQNGVGTSYGDTLYFQIGS